ACRWLWARAGRRAGAGPLRSLPDGDLDGPQLRRRTNEAGEAAVGRARRPPVSDEAGRARLRARDTRARAGVAARVRVHRQAAVRQPARPNAPRVPEHVLPPKPADATALSCDGRRYHSPRTGMAAPRAPPPP